VIKFVSDLTLVEGFLRVLQFPPPIKLNEVYSIQHYVIKFVSDLTLVEGFLRVLQFPPPIKLMNRRFLFTNKTVHHDITKMLLKVVLNTILSLYMTMYLNAIVRNLRCTIFKIWYLKINTSLH